MTSVEELSCGSENNGTVVTRYTWDGDDDYGDDDDDDAVMVMTMMDLREYGEDNGGSPSSPDQKWRVEEEDCERFSELPVNRDDIRHI